MAMHRFRSLTLIFLLIIFTGGLLSCASPAAAPAPEIHIGVITQFTGRASENVWPHTVNGAELLADQRNASGGVQVGNQRMQVKLFFGDDVDSPEGGSDAALKLINQDKVVALVGTSSSRVSIPVGAIAEQARIPFVAHVSTNPLTTEGKQFVFRAIFEDEFQGKVLAQFARNTLKAEQAAVLYDVADVYCTTLAEAFQQEFEAIDGEIVAMETYTTDNILWQEQLERIEKLEPDLLFLPNYHQDIIKQTVDARNLGITATFLGGDAWAWATPDMREGLEGSFFATGYALDTDTEENKAFVEAYRAAYDKDPISESALIYDALGMILTAIEDKGSIDPVAIRDGLAEITEYRGVTGTMQFEGSGDPIKSMVILHVQDGEFVWYEEVKP